MKKNKLWFLPAALLLVACGGTEESTESTQETDSAPEVAIQYGPLLSSEEVYETERIEDMESYNAIEDKSTVIRYVSSAYKAPFPTELLDAYNLQVLAINVDGELPEEIGQYKNLTTLVIGGTVTKMPESVGELENLKAVSFEYCKNLDLEQALGVLANCPNIQHLNLAYMGITELPANIGDFKQLKQLRLGNNPLTTLPESLYSLTSLEQLRLGSNEGLDYEAVLNSAKSMPALKTLWLQYCGFSTLPKVLGEYPALELVHWSEDWKDKNSEQIIANTEKETAKFQKVKVTWDTMSGMFYDIY